MSAFKLLPNKRWVDGDVANRVLELKNETSADTHAFASSVMMFVIEAAVSLFRRRWQDKLPNRLAFFANVRLEGNKSLLVGATLPNGSVVIGKHFSMGVYKF